MSSKYLQRMLRLSGKIFGEYRTPEIPPEIHNDRVYDHSVRNAFREYHYRNENVIRRLSQNPMDLNVDRNPNYYPPHPQHVLLIDKLRELGLFRDEHLDFKEEMIRQQILRGKIIWKRGEKIQKGS